MEQFRRSALDAAIFGAFALLCYVGGATAIIDALRMRSWPLGIFGTMAFGAGALLTYETVSLAFGLPTLSFLTNRTYLGHPAVFLAVLFLVTVVVGALSAHFTVRNGQFDALVALLAMGGLLLGFALAVAGRWSVL